jgi:hypothetical protein
MSEVRKHMIPKHMDPPLLHIYDAADRGTRLTAWIRRNSWRSNVYPLPIEDGLAGLMRALDKLSAERKTFQHCLFETHGNAGVIFFKGEFLDGQRLTIFGGRGYESIFHIGAAFTSTAVISPMMIRGNLLDAAGQVFLRIGGGETFASTRFGSLYPWDYLNGHIYHIASDTCYSRWFPGGVFRDHVHNDLTLRRLTTTYRD